MWINFVISKNIRYKTIDIYDRLYINHIVRDLYLSIWWIMEEKPVIDNIPSENPVISWKNSSERIWYILLGGGNDSMEKRVKSVAKQIETNPDRPVVITWYEFEIEKIKWLLKEAFDGDKKWEDFYKINLEEVLSYDTRTNIRKIKKKKPGFLENLTRFIIPTSESHGRRVEMIFEWIDGFYKKNDMDNLPKLEENRREVVFDRKLPWRDDTFVLELLNSGEGEANYAKLGESIYRTSIGAKLIQYASIALRPKSFVKWYLLPQIKEWLKWNNGDKSMKNYLLHMFQSNKRYA